MDIAHCNICGGEAETDVGPIVHDVWCTHAGVETVAVPKAGLLELLTALRLAEAAFEDAGYVILQTGMKDMRGWITRLISS